MQDGYFFDARGHFFFFTALQLLVYMDRAALSGLVPVLETHFEIDSLQSGVLGSGFMGGFMIASPIAALIANGQNTMTVIGVGMSIWMCAVIVTSQTETYHVLLLARIAAGVGEAAFCSLAPPIIDDTAPPGRRSIYIALYFSAIFVGLAMGLAVQAPLKTWTDGRLIFLGESLTVAPLCIVAVFLSDRFILSAERPKRITSGAESASQKANIPVGELLAKDEHRDRLEPRSFGRNEELASPRAALTRRNSHIRTGWDASAQDTLCSKISAVLCQDIFIFLMLGYAASVFSIGGFGFWAPTYLEAELDMDRTLAGALLGAVTAASGLIGTMVGGLALDRYTEQVGVERGRALRIDRLIAATKISFWCAAVAFPLSLVAAAMESADLFLCFLGLVEFALFMSTAPVNVGIMEAVPENLRGLALGISTFGMHMLGDLIPPMLIGYMRDVSSSLRPGIWLLSAWLVWCVIAWGSALVRVRRLEAEEELASGRDA
eukprot:TRINITY_DN55910_c0_g1_i1.p1 TRINITY_DN55910_c0_g1~~TRINITY_DN55910_c0_g1_i1.p1  ORF type:complete len:491 (+),score=66.95 TRINITY_DN55910_c0_g1_i1:129-1601(+)